mgnify:CR=1 FL=1
MGLGVHFAVDDDTLSALEGAAKAGDDEEVLALVDDLEDEWDEAWTKESDRAWDAIHRVLTDGTLKPGQGPLAPLILGGRSLLKDEGEHHCRLATKAQVKAAAKALEAFTEDEFRARFQKLKAKGSDYEGDGDADDLDYTWDWFLEVRELFFQASQEGRAVLFTATR